MHEYLRRGWLSLYHIDHDLHIFIFFFPPIEYAGWLMSSLSRVALNGGRICVDRLRPSWRPGQHVKLSLRQIYTIEEWKADMKLFSQ